MVKTETAQRSGYFIPEISDARLAELMSRIKPVLRLTRIGAGNHIITHPQGRLMFVEELDPRRKSFSWKPKIIGSDGVSDLKVLVAIRTLHAMATTATFQPTVAEVLSQIPEQHLDQTVAYEVNSDHNDPTVVSEGQDYFQIVQTTLYYR